MSDLTSLPPTLPAPVDDGAAAHLPGQPWPDLALPATGGEAVNLRHAIGRTVVYAYPMTGRPESALPPDWDGIPGARGCTPQSCAFRDHHAELAALGCDVLGLSTQRTEYQQEAATRLHLPYALLSDAELRLAGALRLPTFDIQDGPAGEPSTLLRRLTMILRGGVIEQVFYPVFPPDANAAQVVAWLRERV